MAAFILSSAGGTFSEFCCYVAAGGLVWILFPQGFLNIGCRVFDIKNKIKQKHLFILNSLRSKEELTVVITAKNYWPRATCHVHICHLI